MKQIIKFTIGLALTFSISACSSIELKDFDNAAWKLDRHGCKGDRTTMLSSFETQKESLKEYKELKVLNYLGKPDYIQLAARNQKYYHYFYEGGQQCDSALSDFGRKVSIRFNALNLVTDVYIEK